ncbi:MAG TPA: AAA domain-containing protein, partial [Planctomycetota bacterium]|nr:AAA domain-containing protein [Planctomycetota bacterium]
AIEIAGEKDRQKSDELRDLLTDAEQAHPASQRNLPASADKDSTAVVADKPPVKSRFGRGRSRQRTPFEAIEKNLTALSRTVNSIEAETGAHDLYVGYPWLCGCCSDPDQTYFQAPIMLWPVRLLVSRSPRLSWRLEPIVGEDPFFNETLRLGLGQFHSALLPEAFLEEAADFGLENDDPAAILQWITEKFATLGLNVKRDGSPVSAFRPYTSTDAPRTPPGQFSVVPMAMLGHFPQSDTSLRTDYEQMDEEARSGKPLPPMVAELLGADAEFTGGDSQAGEEVIGVELTTDQIREADTCFVIPTDASQEEVLLAARRNNTLVVHGPPGTGKSQVIVNLISDALWRGERVLLCCQKRAALDVVYSRLKENGLGRNVALVHDPGGDRKELYQHIAGALDSANGRAANEAVLAQESQRIAAAIDRTTDYLKQAADALHSPRRFGLTVHQLYSRMARNGVPKTLPAPLMAAAVKVGAATNDQSLTQLLKRMAELDALAITVGASSHPWSGRENFAGLTISDERAIREALTRLDAACQALMRAQGAEGAAGLSAMQGLGVLNALENFVAHMEEVTAGTDLDTRLLIDLYVNDVRKRQSATRGEVSIFSAAKILSGVSARPVTFIEGKEPGNIAVQLESYNERHREKFRFFSVDDFLNGQISETSAARALPSLMSIAKRME